ncbi:ParB/RepB/Spo0J family partition protein [Desulfobacter latus]|uniref:ParB/RepB/Spo0J family partition protein n=1 Tax=Desulfobacter latus TaxID=2292 RepID=A0A850T422_9BACT|nr:ParB/RepB/Spo0J family partition protein [Desulfobacter latus]NWH06513.1 ParB/RepB/Spo0J family partition protein [Desulfobacter latus]
MTAITLTDIPVSEIDLSDTGFRITSPHHDIEHLTASISQYGIMVAPLVVSGQDKYIVVSGFRRIEAARHAELSRIICRVMPAEETRNAAMAAVTENAFSRELTPAELIRATALLLRFMDAENIAKNAASIFNRPLNTGYINTLAHIHAMPDSVLDLLDQGKISIKACKTLVSMDAQTQTEFLHLFSLIKVSSGRQMEIITWTKEICALEKLSLSQLIQKSPLGTSESDLPGPADRGLDHRDMSALGKQFKTFLVQKRFPALTAVKNQVRKQIKALELDSGLQLAVPENFEGLVYTMQMEFKNVDEFKTHLNRLAELVDNNDFKSLVDR